MRHPFSGGRMNASFAKFSLNPTACCKPTLNAFAVTCVKGLQIDRASSGRHDQSPDALRMVQSKVQACPSSHGLCNEPNFRKSKVINQRQQVSFKQCRIDSSRRDTRWRKSAMSKSNAGRVM